MAKLVVSDLHHRFGRHRVLRGVDLTMSSGQCVVLFGDNGSGKSTLLTLLSTRFSLQKGHYKLDDLDAADQGDTIRSRLVFISHNSHLYGHLTSVENLLFFADLRGLDCSEKRLRAAVETVGLAPFADRPTRWFSAGMKKRLTLARVLVAKPDLLLLDEPYSALDVQGVNWLNTLLADFIQGGGMIIMASHDPQRVAALNHQPHTLRKGRLTAQKELLGC
ncbi:MAG: heme ABC exporter ATP-binding protein CcmA [Magnetococcales bacterium]|nr:heme ABC exporter ATP-binding protein CcmA [Magnetococcales bacterium]